MDGRCRWVRADFMVYAVCASMETCGIPRFRTRGMPSTLPGGARRLGMGAGLPATRAIEAFCDLPAMGGAGAAQSTAMDRAGGAYAIPRGGHAGPMPTHVCRPLTMRAAFRRGRIFIIGRRHAHRCHVSPCVSRADVVVRVAAGDGTGLADVHVARWLNQRGGSPFAVTVSRKVATVESLWSTLRPVRIGARIRMAERLQRRASIRKGGVSLSHERAKSMRCVRKNAIALGVTPPIASQSSVECDMRPVACVCGIA